MEKTLQVRVAWRYEDGHIGGWPWLDLDVAKGIGGFVADLNSAIPPMPYEYFLEWSHQ